ncbi:MAG: glycosyl transferase family 36 [Planctomycetota bacterium]
MRCRYGRFIENGSAYEITDPATPAPWVNVISNGRYGLVVSQNGGGFSWLDHCQLNVLTRWNMDLVRDEQGRFIYIADLDSEDVWSVSPQPCRADVSGFRAVHRPGSTTFEAERGGVRATWKLAVPPGEHAEVWRLTLENTCGDTKRLRIGSYLEWCCGTAPDVNREFHKLFFTTHHDEVRHAVLAEKNLWEAPFGTPDDHWNRPWPYTAGFAAVGFRGERLVTSDKVSFLGRYADRARPSGMTGDRPASRFGRFGDAVAALGGDIELGAGETRELGFVLAIGDDKESLEGTIDRLGTVESIREAADASERDWSERLSRSGVATDREDFNALNNTWLAYQAISARLWGRTGYYQQSGAFGYRDQLQDSQVWLAREPERCRAQILHHAAHQFSNGKVYHWWNPLTETGNPTDCRDDFLWLPLITASYIKETADRSILDETVPFADEGEATLLEHCLRSIRQSFTRFSDRGLPLIGGCDWNDGLSALGNETSGESVWLALFLRVILRDWTSLAAELGLDEDAADFAARGEALVRVVNDVAWDGAWYRRATDVDGHWLGSASSLAGRIFLNAQTWAILGESAPAERRSAAWASVKEHLLTDYGPLLLAPAYTEPDAKIGYITRYAPGARENGGVYMHAATWALAAAAKMRDRDAVERIWASVSPPVRCEDAEAYWAEPYALPGNVDGPLSDLPGRAGWTWYTGSAAWLNKVSMDWLIGMRADWDGLRIDPCSPASLGRVTAHRQWRGRTVRLRFNAAEFVDGDSLSVALDGEALKDNVLTEAELERRGLTVGATVELEASWGGASRVVEPKSAAAVATAEDAQGRAK